MRARGDDPVGLPTARRLEFVNLQENAIEIFMFCDLGRYELSATGSMCGHEADPLVDAIRVMPDDSAATIDLHDADGIDDIAAAILASAVRRGRRRGVEFSIVVGSESASATLAGAGLSQITGQRRHVSFA